jgi:hypothetical protein
MLTTRNIIVSSNPKVLDFLLIQFGKSLTFMCSNLTVNIRKMFMGPHIYPTTVIYETHIQGVFIQFFLNNEAKFFILDDELEIYLPVPRLYSPIRASQSYDFRKVKQAVSSLQIMNEALSNFIGLVETRRSTFNTKIRLENL